jgi:hypothetical protein
MELGAFQAKATLSAAAREILSRPRWVHGGYHGPSLWSLEHGCPCCGSMYGNGQKHIPCEPVACMLCGSVQCHGNGLGNGCCSVCLYGFLPGWSGTSGRQCGYAHCTEPAIAIVPGKKLACMAHAMRKVGAKVQESLALRDSGKGWQCWTFTGPRVLW